MSELARGRPATFTAIRLELAKLAEMLEKGLLAREEFDLMKAKLLWSSNLIPS